MTDAKARDLMMTDVKSEGSNGETAALSLYRRALRDVMGTDCRWVPSDSTYIVQMRKTCPATVAYAFGIARFLQEPDNLRGDYALTTIGGGLRAIDVAPTCWR